DDDHIFHLHSKAPVCTCHLPDGVLVPAWSCLTERRPIQETERDGDWGRKAQRRCAEPSGHSANLPTPPILPQREAMSNQKNTNRTLFARRRYTGGARTTGLLIGRGICG